MHITVMILAEFENTTTLVIYEMFDINDDDDRKEGQTKPISSTSSLCSPPRRLRIRIRSNQSDEEKSLVDNHMYFCKHCHMLNVFDVNNPILCEPNHYIQIAPLPTFNAEKNQLYNIWENHEYNEHRNDLDDSYQAYSHIIRSNNGQYHEHNDRYDDDNSDDSSSSSSSSSMSVLNLYDNYNCNDSNTAENKSKKHHELVYNDTNHLDDVSQIKNKNHNKNTNKNHKNKKNKKKKKKKKKKKNSNKNQIKKHENNAKNIKNSNAIRAVPDSWYDDNDSYYHRIAAGNIFCRRESSPEWWLESSSSSTAAAAAAAAAAPAPAPPISTYLSESDIDRIEHAVYRHLITKNKRKANKSRHKRTGRSRRKFEDKKQNNNKFAVKKNIAKDITNWQSKHDIYEIFHGNDNLSKKLLKSKKFLTRSQQNYVKLQQYQQIKEKAQNQKKDRKLLKTANSRKTKKHSCIYRNR